MIVVIIAGGSGTRLWPLSTHDFPKHLLKLTNERSLLQNTYDRVKDLSDNIFVIPEKSHAKHVYQQLPSLNRKNIIVEPARRGTASCFVLALDEIKRRGLPDQAVLFLWADNIVQNNKAFAESVKQMAKLAEKEQRLVFMGIKPTYPSTGFGYIHMGNPSPGAAKNVFELRQYVEKPDAATAKRYLKSGKYLWNTGYLTGTISTFESQLRQHAPRLWNDYQLLLNTKLPILRRRCYMGFISEPIDTALSEHVPDALVIAGHFNWMDIGSFHDLHSASQRDKGGNHVSGPDIELVNVVNSYVRNETDTPIAVIGVKDLAVIATENGVLVTNKADAQKVGDISKKLQSDKRGVKWFEKL